MAVAAEVSNVDMGGKGLPPSGHLAEMAGTAPHGLSLAFGLGLEDLYARTGLERIDDEFKRYLQSIEPGLHEQLEHARAEPGLLPPRVESNLLIALAPHLERFIALLFRIEPEVIRAEQDHQDRAALFMVKRLFVQRRAFKKFSREETEGFDSERLVGLLAEKFAEPVTEQSFAQHVQQWLENEELYAPELDLALRYAAWASLSQNGRRKHADGVLFKNPHKVDPENLITVETVQENGLDVYQIPVDRRRAREGFDLTDPGTNLVGALDQAHYCIWCHNQQKDSCSRGLMEKQSADNPRPRFKKSAAGVDLAGCPLEVKISEMNFLKAQGFTVGALAMVIVDNPMLVATGHRICNDCMKSCIFQKQEPVDIPQVETRVLKDVLRLPWGFEIYSLLAKWNPLNLRRPLPGAPTGKRVLVVGLGPAGFTLAHHLLNDGHAVVAVDGLKIEPLPSHLNGLQPGGERSDFVPIRNLHDLDEALGSRVMAGFGGVAEYGITVRWNKNYLKVARLLLERRAEFAGFGGVRFGGALSVDTAFEMGFDHIALCTGAGRPTILDIPNGLAKGVRQASDFLMALQLTGAAKSDSIANLTIRLPVVVIGGGLTAIDTATEALAYYPLQVERFLTRYETLVAERGEPSVRAAWSADEADIADEFVAHARAIRQARDIAKQEMREFYVSDLLREWGGVTVAYRRQMRQSPSYTLNHEEVAKALEEGIRFAEGLTPRSVSVDSAGHAQSITFASAAAQAGQSSGEPPHDVTLPARTILVAAGTQPNTLLHREDPSNAPLDGRYFRACDDEGRPVSPERSAKPAQAHVLMQVRPDGRAVSFFGDLHPSFSGNVVKAMASAKQGYPVITRLLSKQNAPVGSHETASRSSLGELNGWLGAHVREVRRLTPNIVEVVLHAPSAALAFRPGQFFRLQNYETNAIRVHDTTLAMEGLALTGAWVDREEGLISTIVLEMGGSSNLCALLKPGEPVVLMGPTGTPTEIPSGETVVLAGGGLGNAVLFSIGQALREAGSRVLYFAGYKSVVDRYYAEEIEKAADVVVWCCDEAPGFAPARLLDKTFVGNIVAAMHAYGSGQLGEMPIRLAEADRVIAIGSAGMMAAVAQARKGALAEYMQADHVAIGSINSPMQCMMKEICGQCLQVQNDPRTGLQTVVFSCCNQDQPLDWVDFRSLQQRLEQNATQEKLARMWIDRCLAAAQARPG